MSDADNHGENHAAGGAAAAPAKKGGMLPWLAVGAVSAGLGAAVPIGLSMMGGSSDHGGGDHAAASSVHGGGHGHTEAKAGDSKMAIVDYGNVSTNLNDGRMNRYLRINIALHVRSTDEEKVKQAVSQKNLIIRDWLVNHVGDKSLDDVRGKAGQNMLRREIRDYFNATLFSDSYDKVYEVLFTDFAIQ